MITILEGWSDKYFSTQIPDLEFSINGSQAEVAISVEGEEIYRELLTPSSGRIVLAGMAEMLQPYAKRGTQTAVSATITELADQSQMGTRLASCVMVYSKVEVSTQCDDFCDRYFMSIMQGTRRTAMGRLEYLSFVGDDAAVVTAWYADRTTKEFNLLPVAGQSGYPTIDVSPAQFATEGKLLMGYTVRAGLREQEYEIDLHAPDCAPVLIFDNSFGVEELIYCTGTHKVAPEFRRESMVVRGFTRNYDIAETRKMQADTGIMTFDEAQWAEELFRSDYVRVVNFYHGEAHVGKEVVITDSKSERSNDVDELPRFTFSYHYSQRNHNVLDLMRPGRIFDNTFDNTFE